jgi:hypothetical protein
VIDFKDRHSAQLFEAIGMAIETRAQQQYLVCGLACAAVDRLPDQVVDEPRAHDR